MPLQFPEPRVGVPGRLRTDEHGRMLRIALENPDELLSGTEPADRIPAGGTLELPRGLLEQVRTSHRISGRYPGTPLTDIADQTGMVIGGPA